MRRIIRDLACVVAIAMMLYALRRTTAAIEHPPAVAPPPPPLDFRLVEKRYSAIPLGGSREQVEALLGPPTQRDVWEPELKRNEADVERGRRDLGLPAERYWDRWTDPADKDKWVAVLYGEGKVYYMLKKGF